MKDTDLYNQLEKDFYKQGMSDDWYSYMPNLEKYICDNFKRRSIGVMCDFAEEVNKVYTAVFPSDDVLNKILDDGVYDSMLFVHHALAWDLGKTPGVAFYEVNPELLEKLRERRVSLFCFHAPLDNFGEYSTGKTLAEAIGLEIEKPFFEYSGTLAGVIGNTTCKDTSELNAQYSQAIGHETKLYQYGERTITNKKVAVVAGGGCDDSVINELIKNEINVLITGVTVENSYTTEAHKLAKQNRINILGGTHYSSEKFACIAMCGYFEKLGLAAEFVEDKPCLDDLEKSWPAQ